jgi:NAD(P)-dependent dehydrogenase (short-subunit alcohol dehydrogenase family)
MSLEKSLFNLEKKVALVTGAALGLGRSFAQTLAEAGADMIISDIDKDHLDETEGILKATGRKVLKILADVSSPADVARMVDETASKFSQLNIAVNNAGIITKPARFHEMPPEDWNKVISVNLTGVFLCMQKEIGLMLKQGNGGSIINISSVLGMVGLDSHLMPRVSYIASKHGLAGLTKQGAVEYAEYGIRVNAIAPSWFAGTALSRDRDKVQTTEEKELREKQIIALTPMKRRGQISELQGLLLFLASDASAYTTGQILASDGGWTAH